MSRAEPQKEGGGNPGMEGLPLGWRHSLCAKCLDRVLED